MGFFDKIKDAFAGVAVCEICEQKVTFKIRVQDERLQPEGNHLTEHVISKSVYCRVHGFEVIGVLIRNFKQPITFTEIGNKNCSGTFFYEPQDLKLHAYEDDSKQILEKYLDEVRGAGEDFVMWLPSDMCFPAENPLIKPNNGQPELISKDELMKRILSSLEKMETKYPKAEFFFIHPRGNGGLWLWDPNV